MLFYWKVLPSNLSVVFQMSPFQESSIQTWEIPSITFLYLKQIRQAFCLFVHL